MSVPIPPHIDTQPLPQVIYANEGMRVKLVCSVVEGDLPIYIKWYKNDQPLSLSGDILLQNSDDYSLLVFKKIAYEDGGNYTCHAANKHDFDTRISQLKVNVPPKWIIEPINETSIVKGKQLVINCSADGHPPARISWKRSTYSTIKQLTDHLTSPIISNENINNQSNFRDILSNYRHQVYANGTLIIQNTDKTDTGLYMCSVNNGIGAGLSKMMQVKILRK